MPEFGIWVLLVSAVCAPVLNTNLAFLYPLFRFCLLCLLPGLWGVTVLGIVAKKGDQIKHGRRAHYPDQQRVRRLGVDS
jgi:hypothetical protein